MTHLTEDQTVRAENAADELAAEQSYTDMLARPETVVDAFDVFGDPDITVEGNTATLHRPAAGWRSLEELLRAHPEAFVTLGNRGDDVEYGPVCVFCGCPAAVCRCD